MADDKPVRPGDLTDAEWWEPQRAAQQAMTESRRPTPKEPDGNSGR